MNKATAVRIIDSVNEIVEDTRRPISDAAFPDLKTRYEAAADYMESRSRKIRVISSALVMLSFVLLVAAIANISDHVMAVMAFVIAVLLAASFMTYIISSKNARSLDRKLLEPASLSQVKEIEKCKHLEIVKNYVEDFNNVSSGRGLTIGEARALLKAANKEFLDSSLCQYYKEIGLKKAGCTS